MEYFIKGCGGKGIKIVNIIVKNGLLVCLVMINGNEDIMVIIDIGVIIWINVVNIF